jgi:hypothetical protein
LPSVKPGCPDCGWAANAAPATPTDMDSANSSAVTNNAIRFLITSHLLLIEEGRDSSAPPRVYQRYYRSKHGVLGASAIWRIFG